MLGLFKKTSKLEKLQKQYERLMSDWHKLSTTNRTKSDEKYAEAQKVLDQITLLKSN